jgi:hypothetical protein
MTNIFLVADDVYEYVCIVFLLKTKNQPKKSVHDFLKKIGKWLMTSIPMYNSQTMSPTSTTSLAQGETYLLSHYSHTDRGTEDRENPVPVDQDSRITGLP